VWTGASAVSSVPLLPSFLTLYFAGNSDLLKKIVHVDIALTASYKKCWSAELTEACEGLHASERYTNCVKAATSLPSQDDVVNLHELLHAIWRELDGAGPRMHAHKLATYYSWMALSLKPSIAQNPPHLHPRSYGWSLVGMCFVKLLGFACTPTT